MKAYSKAAQVRHILPDARTAAQSKAAQIVAREEAVKSVTQLVEHADLIVLSVLHSKYGFGAKRLKDFYREFMDTYDDYVRRYMTAEDIKAGFSGGERWDTIALKEHLAGIGFDYDKIVAEARDARIKERKRHEG